MRQLQLEGIFQSDQWRRQCFAGDHPEEIQFNKLVFLKHTAANHDDSSRNMCRTLFFPRVGTKERRDSACKHSRVRGTVALPRHYELPIDGRLPDYLVNETYRLKWQSILTYDTASKEARLCRSVYRSGKRTDIRYAILIPVYDLDGVMKTFQGRDIPVQQNVATSFLCSFQLQVSSLQRP